MSKFIFLCAILFTGQQYVAGVLSPGYEYVKEADTWLRLHVTPATWQEARRQCQFEGGILASPSTGALAKAMLAMMTAHKVNREVFTGIHGLITKGDFMSLDGVSVEGIYLDWAQGEPDGQNAGGNCVVLNPAADVADVSCTSVHPYFCRKENVTMRFNEQCGTTATGYDFFSLTGSCYKFHRHAKNWLDAARVCHAEGGHLAIINSDTEAKLIKDIFKKNPVDTVIGAKHNDVAIVGFWKWDANEEWLTINGQTLAEAGYEQWGKGQPNNYGGVQTCGSIQRGGGFDDLAPYDREPFICEINIPANYDLRRIQKNDCLF